MTFRNPVMAGGAKPRIVIVTYAIAVVFLVVGVLGFVLGVTTNYDSMAFAGHESGALLFGVFAVSVLHNLVHLVFAADGGWGSGVFGRRRCRLSAAVDLWAGDRQGQRRQRCSGQHRRRLAALWTGCRHGHARRVAGQDHRPAGSGRLTRPDVLAARGGHDDRRSNNAGRLSG